MDITVISTLIGGVGLFLLGMHLMTNGLRLAAGRALRNILEKWTTPPVKGILAGITITSLVQSSSAVTVATLGFVNAGLIRLQQAVTVIYGSNIGTTMTAWLVAMIGFHINIKAFALPAIGIGMLLRLIWHRQRLGASGEALAGFGVFFLGIDILKSAFEGMGSNIQFAQLSPEGIDLITLVASGFLMTLLTQSSSAAMAIILTAAGGNVIPLEAAGAMVIGANIGTTSTALIAVIGATPNAKRVAAAHVGFNVMTGAVALLLLPWLLALLQTTQAQMGLTKDAPAILALFHTTFNVLGVALMWPITGLVVKFLNRRFRSAEEDEARPRHLDQTLASTPLLAFNALGMELARIAHISSRMSKSALSAESTPGGRITADKNIIHKLVIAAGEFSTSIQRSDLPSDLAEALPNGMRVSRYYAAAAQLAESIAEQQSKHHEIEHAPLNKEINDFKRLVVHLVDACDLNNPEYECEKCSQALEELEERYQHLKVSLLKNGTEGRIKVQHMVAQLELTSMIRRLAEQIEKGARYLSNFNAYAPADELEIGESPTNQD